MKIIRWLFSLIVVLFASAAIFHSYKYHGHYDDGNIVKIAYRGVEQFWHKHDKEYRISVKDLLSYKQMSIDKVYAEVESKGFVESEGRRGDGDDGYYKWHYKSKDTMLAKYEIGFALQNDTSLVIYTIPDKDYVSELHAQIISAGFIESKTDSLHIGVMHWLNNQDLGIKIMEVESIIPDGKPSQFIIANKAEFSPIFQQVKNRANENTD